ncbi:MAG: hypothetical protein GF390_04080 [Candidatus Pacebacteria bacterium]|nr:hypothetical protein [Candidatus Paceibacterota bacterium]
MWQRVLATSSKLLALLLILSLEVVIGLPIWFFWLSLSWLLQLKFYQQVALTMILSYFLATSLQFSWAWSFLLLTIGQQYLLQQRIRLFKDRTVRWVATSLVLAVLAAWLGGIDWQWWLVWQLVVDLFLLVALTRFLARKFQRVVKNLLTKQQSSIQLR